MELKLGKRGSSISGLVETTNRTIVELKRLGWVVNPKAVNGATNRTIVELKQFETQSRKLFAFATNRTIVELKQKHSLDEWVEYLTTNRTIVELKHG